MVSIGEIACFEQFLLCRHVFKKLSAAEATERVYMRKVLTSLICMIETYQVEEQYINTINAFSYIFKQN